MRSKKSIDGIIFYFEQSAASQVDQILCNLAKSKPNPNVQIEAADYFLDVMRKGRKEIALTDLVGLYSIAN